jgi:UDPglucose 6-dehydrogenase
MNVGFIGLGKLGLPCALAAEDKGHTIYGYDIDDNVENIIKNKKLPYREEGAQELLNKSNINWSSMSEVVQNSEIIFVPIQTPHNEKYEGVTRLPEERVDFDYTWLKSGLKNLAEEIKKQGEDKIVVIISTVLPGTIRREIKPLLNEHVKLCYNPFFIAMGTTIRDFLTPEFVLFGHDDEKAYEKAKTFYSTLHDRPVYKCTIEEAEMIKVTYNTYITMKICLANTVMELSHKLNNINCDNVMKGLFLADQRLISTKYLIGGMGDGGGCHPRDNIALSWLAQEVDLSFDWYENLMLCRENQTEWLRTVILEEKSKSNLPVVILGKTFKKETNLTVGSTSILLKNMLDELDYESTMYDPWVDSGNPPLNEAAIYFIGTNHDKFLDYKFPEGSIVIDPWRIINEQEGVKLIKIGDSTCTIDNNVKVIQKEDVAN